MTTSELPGSVIVHRIGGADVGNLSLKSAETTLIPPGISVLIGGDSAGVAAAMRRVFGPKSSIGRLASVVGAASVADVRKAGFDLMADPTKKFPNHGRLIHPAGESGFSPENLAALAVVFVNHGDL